MSFLKQNSGGKSNALGTHIVPSVKQPIPAFDKTLEMGGDNLRRLLHQAKRSWLGKTPSKLTRVNYQRDLHHFMSFASIDADQLEQLLAVRPEHVAAWRDELRERGLTNSTIRRKMTVLRSFFSYLQTYGYVGANPAHGKFVKAPSVPRDGKTVGLSPADCRRLLEAPNDGTAAGIRDRAMLGVLAYSACRVGELVTLNVRDFRTSGEHRVLSIFGKGGKERYVPLHVEAVERLAHWTDTACIADDRTGPLFRPTASPRGRGRDGFRRSHLTTRSVEHLVKRYARQVGLDEAVTVHSLRVTALTTARERGADIIDLQDFAGHADPRTTLVYYAQTVEMCSKLSLLADCRALAHWVTQHNIRLGLADLEADSPCRCPRTSYKERSQSSRFSSCCHEGMRGTGDGSAIFSSAFRFISRFALA